MRACSCGACADVLAGGDSGSPVSAQTRDPSAITFVGTISVTGMDQVSGTFDDDNAGTTYSACSDWANGSNLFGFGMPTPTAPVSGTPISLILSLNYRGPGTYSASTDLNLFNLSVGDDDFGDPGSFTVQVNPDGSGTATLVGSRSTSSMSPAAEVTVSETWTCQPS